MHMFAKDVHMHDSFEFYGYLVLSMPKTRSSYDEVAIGHKTIDSNYFIGLSSTRDVDQPAGRA